MAKRLITISQLISEGSLSVVGFRLHVLDVPLLPGRREAEFALAQPLLGSLSAPGCSELLARERVARGDRPVLSMFPGWYLTCLENMSQR